MKQKIILLFITMLFLSSCSKDETPDDPNDGNQNEEPSVIKDFDGNIYDPIVIDDQTWLKQNLATAHFNDGSVIPTDLSDENWQSTTEGAVVDNPAKQTLYGDLGKLYNWHAISSSKGICPEGYKVPTEADFKTLIDVIGGTDGGGDLKAKNGHWTVNGGTNKGVTNSTDFSALPAGIRLENGEFSQYSKRGEFWTTTDDNDEAKSYYLLENSKIVFWQSGPKNQGASCRCIKE